MRIDLGRIGVTVSNFLSKILARIKTDLIDVRGC